MKIINLIIFVGVAQAAWKCNESNTRNMDKKNCGRSKSGRKATKSKAKWHMFSNSCAQMWEHSEYKGNQFHIGSKDDNIKMDNLGDKTMTNVMSSVNANDQISSLIVRDGCILRAWEHSNQNGDYTDFEGYSPYVTNAWNDRISSIQCFCPNGFNQSFSEWLVTAIGNMCLSGSCNPLEYELKDLISTNVVNA